MTAPIPDYPEDDEPVTAAELSGLAEARAEMAGPPAPDAIAAAFAPLRELAAVLMADGIARQQAAHAIGRMVTDAEARIRAGAPAAPAQLAQAFRAGQQDAHATQEAADAAAYETID